MQDNGFSLTYILPYEDKICQNKVKILSLYGRMQVSENPYSRIFYVVECTKEGNRLMIDKRLQLFHTFFIVMFRVDQISQFF